MKVRTRFAFDYLLYVALVVVVGMFSSGVSAWAQANPVPLVNNPLVPASALPGGASFTLTVNGTGFVAGSTVDWNSIALQTTFVSGSQLTASVPSANITTAGTASVTVVSPAPGGGTSNVAWFAVRKPFPAVAFGDTEIPIGSSSVSPITADFNGDGKLDAAVGTFSGTTAVLLGNGDGTFQPLMQYPPSGHLLPGDFNGDGVVDIAIFISDVSVLLGNGDGTFQPHRDTSAGLAGTAFAAADLNGDGKLDLALINSIGGVGQVGIMLGNGDGTFQAPVLYSVGSTAGFVAIGDFNSDGKLDLAVTGVAQGAAVVAIFPGNGDGTFQAAEDNNVAGFTGEALVAGDFNGDGKLDLAVKTQPINLDTGIALLLGNGDGSFQTPIDYPSTLDTLMATADLNGDGKLDLMIPTFEKTQVLLGTGDGHLGPLNPFPSSKFPTGVAPGDFNGDGMVDLLVSGAPDDSVAILPQITSVLSGTLAYFGSVKLGKSKTRQVTLMNYGDSVLKIDRIGVQGDDASVFSESNTCGTGVLPGRNCRIAITFTPQSPRKYTRARVAIHDSAAKISQRIDLEGEGLK